MVYIHIPRVGYASKRSIASLVDNCLSLQRELMKAYSDGLKLLATSAAEPYVRQTGAVAASTRDTTFNDICSKSRCQLLNLKANFELEEERVLNFHLRCMLVRKELILRIHELHQRYDIELCIHRYNLWLEYAGAKENFILTANTFIDTKVNYTPRLIQSFKVETYNSSNLLSLLMRTIASMYDEIMIFINRAYRDSNFIKYDDYQELSERASNFLHSSTKQLKMITLNAGNFIQSTKSSPSNGVIDLRRYRNMTSSSAVYLYTQGFSLYIVREGYKELRLI